MKKRLSILLYLISLTLIFGCGGTTPAIKMKRKPKPVVVESEPAPSQETSAAEIGDAESPAGEVTSTAPTSAEAAESERKRAEIAAARAARMEKAKARRANKKRSSPLDAMASSLVSIYPKKYPVVAGMEEQIKQPAAVQN